METVNLKIRAHPWYGTIFLFLEQIAPSLTSYIRADRRTCRWLSRGCCHVAWSKWWVWRDSLADFSQRWQGISSRALTCSCMPWANGKGEFFSGSKTISRCEWIWSALSVKLNAWAFAFVLKKSYVQKKTVYSGIKLIWEFPKQCLTITKNPFLIVCYCSVCLHWRVCKSFWVAHLHSAARPLSSPNRCFQLSTNFDKDCFRCLLCWHAATISSNAERLLTYLISCIKI